MHLIVGLGNPGAAYAPTRHNAGMWVIERAAARWSVRLAKRGMAHRGSGRLGSELLELAGTLDWMNITGPPLKGLLREYSLSADNLILVHDDLDLDLGRLRIKQAGGHGGITGLSRSSTRSVRPSLCGSRSESVVRHRVRIQRTMCWRRLRALSLKY